MEWCRYKWCADGYVVMEGTGRRFCINGCDMGDEDIAEANGFPFEGSGYDPES